MANSGEIPKRQFGKTGVETSPSGLAAITSETRKIRRRPKRLWRAIDGGVTFFDNCWESHRQIAKNFSPMPEQEMAALRRRCSSEAANGHLELFKTTTKYDGKVGRQQHEYPDVEEMPA